MSVQLSVVIWTVINFCILMLVLWKLLFKPTLAFMDKRAEKIRRVRDEKAELEAASAAEAAKAAAESAGKKEREAAAKAAEIAAIREEAEKREAEAEQAGREAFEAAKADIEAEKAAIGAFLSERTDDLAAQFNERLILLR